MRPVVSYRIAPRTIGYAIAAVAAFSIISGAVGGLEASRTAGGDLLFVALIAVGVGAPGALVAWNRGVEVRVYDAGIMSIGPGTAQLIRWRDIARFEVDRYRSTPFAIYAVLGDGPTGNHPDAPEQTVDSGLAGVSRPLLQLVPTSPRSERGPR